MAAYVDPAPTYRELVSEIGGERLVELIASSDGFMGAEHDYVHWDKLRHLDPPDGLTSREWWFGIKIARRTVMRALPLTDADGSAFSYSTPDRALRLLHSIDQRCSGEIAMPEVVTEDAQARQHYLVNSLMEEAIRSSQLEGATTSRRVAKDLLRSGRAPKDRSELMILNNYRALRFMREDVGDRLTPEAVLELQRILTEGTLDDPASAGRLQTPEEERVSVVDALDGSVIHKPPPAEQLPERLRAMCDFANQDDEKGEFIHPVVRAILLHFWLACDHPFEDGNGRTARTLFYWFMRTRGYWLVEYLSISRILRKAPAKYSKACVLTETDEGDITYFLLYQLDVIARAIDELHRYLRRKVEEIQDVERLLKGSEDFNYRQLALLSDALRNPGATYTYRAHATYHSVTHETARNDLTALSRAGLLERRRLGRAHTFSSAPDLVERLKRQGAAR